MQYALVNVVHEINSHNQNVEGCSIQITDKEKRSQNSYTSLSSAMELKFGVFRFLPTTHAETNASKMRPRSSRTMQHFTCVYLHTQTAVHTYLMNHGYFDCGKNPNTPNLSPLPGYRWCRFWDLWSISAIQVQIKLVL